MIVSSPIGELPFVPTRLKYHARGLTMEGQMGAWPASVQIGVNDTTAILRMVATPAAVLAGAAIVARALLRRSARRSPN